MKTKHTPGPWKVEEDGFIRVGTKTIGLIGNAYYHPDDFPERNANARMMAAAPDMLETLLLAEIALHTAAVLSELNGDSQANAEFLIVAEDCRKAIAKAKGEDL